LKAHTTIVGDGQDQPSGPPGLRLVVIGRDSYQAYDLPPAGTVTVGRAETSDVRIDDPLASRSHARLTVGKVLTIEDLGSINGTRVRDRPIGRGERVAIQPGETVLVGSSVLLVHSRSPWGGGAGAAAADGPTHADSSFAPGDLVPRDGAMQAIYRLAEQAAAGTINILILGETGVGKEVMARAVHRLSPRRQGPYVCLNCAALSESLLESELFGHERGAFTGAQSAKPGLLETAEGGTLFLDEVGEMPASTQAKLLRVIETREVTRLGSVRPRRIDVRFVAATNRDLDSEVDGESFRRDLYFRLNGVSLRIPPLRERRAEVQPLAQMFLRQICAELRRPEPLLSRPVIEALERKRWPGNIRELKNVIERAVLLCGGPEITLSHLPDDRGGERPSERTEQQRSREIDARARSGADARRRVDTGPNPAALSKSQAQERALIIDALAACAGNQSRAAKMLGMPRRTFVARLDRYQIPRPKKGTRDDDELE
jgi:two-component system, NtrC family, response regulator AtoC